MSSQRNGAVPAKNQGRVGERIVRLRDMQAAATIGLLLMSVNVQPGMAQQSESDGTGSATTGGERYYGAECSAAGSGAEAD